MIDKDAHALDPPLKRLGAPVFDLGELRECEGSVLGRGAFGVVRSIEGYPGLAVKEIRLDGLGASALQSLRFELAMLTTFSHPGILRCHQIIEDKDGDLIHIVMDRHDTSLETLIMKHRRQREPVSAETIIALVGQITGALTYLHSARGVDANGDPYQGIVHRDLKPDNVLISEDGNRVVLADFGLCMSAMASGSTRARSPAYMAPETLLYNSTSPASDIWALGVIIYELAALKRPDFLGDKEPRHVFIDGWKPDLSAIEDDSVRNILERIFVLDPVKRPTARSLQELLNPSISSTGMLRLRIASLEDALGAAGARTDALGEAIAALKDKIDAQSIEISTLRRDIAIKSSAIDSLKQQFTKAIEDLKQQLAEDAISLKPQTPSTITGHTILSALDSSWTPLMCAAFFGDVEAAKRHLNEMDERNSDGDTAYTLAAKAGQGTILELLDPTDEDGVTALIRAAVRGDVNAVRALIPLQKGKKMARDTYINGLRISIGVTALMMAAVHGHTKVVKLLVEEEGGMKDNIGRTALMWAESCGHSKCVKLLIEKEAGMRDNYGYTALMVAAQGGCAECIKLLLNKETGMQNIWGSTALMLAAHNMHPECVELLMEKEVGISGWTELMYAAYRGDVDTVRSSLHMKGERDIGGWTALMRAAEQGHEQVVELLTKERGMTNNSHQTALMWAARNGHPGCVRLLLEKEGGMLDKYGGTALMFAVEHDHIECIKLLLEKEAGMRDKNGWTALMRAVLVGHTECVRLLAEEEKDMKTVRERFGYLPGTTALNIAKREGRTELVSILSG
ncbi:Serine/threonine protein kinase [Giardia duodenalis]|uniref:Serine/threonine protein kinase n=1 Tax=Giardia intestinalis TaxID=5741 RepID=V6TTH1_GIAIN|nr:Serine/threonine protein kinase [Giardia intestinalis]